MARKRMIDPSIWSDEGMADLTPRQQLLYVGLFSNADDEGRLKGSPAAVALMLPTIYQGVPRDDVGTDIDAVLASMTRLVRYVVDGRVYLAFGNYARWQKIDRPTPSELPAPPDPRPLDDPSTNAPRFLAPNRREENGKEENGREENGGADEPAAAADARPTVASHPYTLLEALCEAIGQDVSVLPKRAQEKQLGVAKRLVADGFTPSDIGRIVGWLGAQSWVTGGIDLFLIEKQADKWRLAGSPATVAARAAPTNGRASPSVAERNLQHIAEFRRQMGAEPVDDANVIDVTGRSVR